MTESGIGLVVFIFYPTNSTRSSILNRMVVDVILIIPIGFILKAILFNLKF